MNDFSITNQKGGPSLRVGLLLNDVVGSQTLYDFVQWVLSHPKIVETHLILLRKPATDKPHTHLDFRLGTTRSAGRNGIVSLSELAFRALELLERHRIKRDPRHSGHVRKLELSHLIKNTMIIANTGNQIDPADVDKIKGLNFDLFLMVGAPRRLTGAILNSSRLGIISLQLGDDRTNRGGPAGFWEVYLQRETTGFTIERLTDELDSRNVFMRGQFATRHYYLLNQAFVFRKSIHYLKLFVEQVAATGRLPDALPNLPYSHTIFRAPLISETAIYVARTLFDILKKRLRRMLYIDYRWNVAFVHRNWRDIEFQNGIKLKQRRFHSLADPFVISKNGKNYCFVEDLDHLKDRGSIAVYELTDNEGVRLGTALEEDFHLSFPYLFEFLGELYMCPETSEKNEIRIYKCVEFPLRWKLEKIIMQNVCAADTMIFERDGKWWMLTNIDPAGIRDYCSELFVFSSDSPFETDWRPHPLNPIIVDASRARNAGCAADGGAYIRFSQGQGFDFYGKRLLINEIIELNDASYRETCLSVANASFGGGAVGTHHMHSNGKITAFDFSVNSKLTIDTEPI